MLSSDNPGNYSASNLHTISKILPQLLTEQYRSSCVCLICCPEIKNRTHGGINTRAGYEILSGTYMRDLFLHSVYSNDPVFSAWSDLLIKVSLLRCVNVNIAAHFLAPTSRVLQSTAYRCLALTLPAGLESPQETPLVWSLGCEPIALTSPRPSSILSRNPGKTTPFFPFLMPSRTSVGMLVKVMEKLGGQLCITLHKR